MEKIVLYPGPKSRESGTGNRLCIGIKRRPGATPLPSGNEPARHCPVPGLAQGATRQVVAWRLDRERLKALTAAVAPGIPVIDADPVVEDPAIEGPGVEGQGTEGTAIEA